MRRGNIIRFTHLFQHILEGGCPTITVSPSSIADLTAGQATTINLSSTGGTAPYTYTVTSGSLPTGLTLNGSTGVISGIPTNDGAASFQITSTDANTCTGIKSYSFNVNYEADVQAFITAAGITDTTQKNAINTLVVDLKGYGIWSKMKAIYPFVGGSASTHKFNLKDPRDLDAAFRLVFTGGWTHSSNGALPNGVNGTADTFLNENTILTLNNEHISIYLRTNTATLAGDIGAFVSNTFQSNILPRFSNFVYGRIHATAGQAISNTDSRGFFMANRTNNTNVNVYKNTTFTVVSSTVTGKVNDTFIFGRRAKTEGLYSDREIAFSTIGDGLNATEANNLYTAIQAYQTALNRQV